jgi:MFS family permease
MTDAAADARRDHDARLAWRIGGILLLACAAVSIVAPSLGGTPLAAVGFWVRSLLFSAALLVFAFGVRGAGSVVARQPLGVSALVVLAVWPLVSGLVSDLVPFSMDLAEFFLAWGYVSLAVQLGAAIVAVIVIARAGAVLHPWRWAPLWALVAALAPQLILQAVVASPGADVQAMAGPVNGLSQIAAIAVPLGLGLAAILLAPVRTAPGTVQVYPPAD